MGDRVNFIFTDGVDKPVLVLYSHWGYTGRHQDLAAAIAHAEPRWGDQTYCARMIISHMLKDDIDSETGYGLYASTLEEMLSGRWFTEDYVLIDLLAMTVDLEGTAIPFKKYVELLA